MSNLTDKIYIINNIIDSILKYNISLEYNNSLFSDYYNINNILDIVLDFFNNYDYNMYNSLLNMIDNKKIKFLSKEIYSDEENSYRNSTKDVTIVVSNTLRDAFSLIHEFSHLYYLSNNKVINAELLEVIPIYMEFKFNDYLKNNNIIEEHNFNFVYNRIVNVGMDSLYLDYIYLIKNNSKVMLIRNINKKLYLSKVNELLDSLGNEKKELILKYQDKFEEQIDNNGFYHFDLDYRFRYVLALYYVPYMVKSNNRDLLNEINSFIISKDKFNGIGLNDCKDEFDKLIGKVSNKVCIKSFNINEIESFIDDMINIFKDNNINIEDCTNKEYSKDISIDESYGIVLDFLGYFDPSLKEMFLNSRSGFSSNFMFLSKDMEPIDDFYHSCVKYDGNGEANVVVSNSIKDVFVTVHEFIHYVYFEKNFEMSSSFNSFLEFGTLSIEYYVWDYLRNYTEYGNEADIYMINRFNNNVTNCYLNKYRFFYKGLLDKYKYKDKIQEVIGDEIYKLSDDLKSNFINNRDFYYLNVDCSCNSYADIYSSIKYSFRYIYASFIAPYIYEVNDKKMFDKICRMWFNKDDKIIVDGKLLYEYYNKYLRLFNELKKERRNGYEK